MINLKNNKVVLTFGTGDIGISVKPKLFKGAVYVGFKEIKPKGIGLVNFTEEEIKKEDKVIMLFSNTESIDAFIKTLIYAKKVLEKERRDS